MFAVLSDIHANLEALEAVLADVARRPVSAIYCLGDVIGYGPNPVECLDRAMTWDLVVMGNFDEAFLTGDMEAWGVVGAVLSVQMARRLLPDGSPARAFVAQRPHRHQEGDFLFVHASPRNPLHEYLFSEDIYNQRKMQRIGELLERYCFCGHTHIPGVFVEPATASGQWQYFSPDEVNHFWRFDGRKAIVNVGSVGQPRDGDRRACYVTVDGWDVTFHRVEYDVDATVAKIYANPDLDNLQGDRLREGR